MNKDQWNERPVTPLSLQVSADECEKTAVSECTVVRWYHQLRCRNRT